MVPHLCTVADIATPFWKSYNTLHSVSLKYQPPTDNNPPIHGFREGNLVGKWSKCMNIYFSLLDHSKHGQETFRTLPHHMMWHVPIGRSIATEYDAAHLHWVNIVLILSATTTLILSATTTLTQWRHTKMASQSCWDTVF